jgi:hypothetical protein
MRPALPPWFLSLTLLSFVMGIPRYFPVIEGARRSETFETASTVLNPTQRNRPQLNLSLELPTVEQFDPDPEGAEGAYEISP